MKLAQALPEPPGEIGVAVTNTQGDLPIDADRITAIVRQVLIGEGLRDGEISIAVVDNASIRVINARHLNHDWPTDVVSFLFDREVEGAIDGELIISAEMARHQAALRGIEPQIEFMLYLVHGLLHLCGYDDRDAGAVAAMRRREDEVLRDLGIANPFPCDEAEMMPLDESIRGGERWPR